MKRQEQAAFIRKSGVYSGSVNLSDIGSGRWNSTLGIPARSQNGREPRFFQCSLYKPPSVRHSLECLEPLCLYSTSNSRTAKDSMTGLAARIDPSRLLLFPVETASLRLSASIDGEQVESRDQNTQIWPFLASRLSSIRDRTDPSGLPFSPLSLSHSLHVVGLSISYAQSVVAVPPSFASHLVSPPLTVKLVKPIHPPLAILYSANRRTPK